MSKKITHERIKQIIIEDEPFRQDEMLLYVEQQEKQEKLLELYIKIYNGITDYHDYDELSELQKEIKELENEN